jgi:uncharacterized OB-fold protein
MSREDARWERPAPLPTRNSAFFWEGALRDELLGQRCSECLAFRHPPRPMCPDCRSLNWEAVELSGRGTIHAWMLPVHPQMPMFEDPLICVLVDLEEGIRLFSNLYDCDPREVETGMAVEVFFVTTQNAKKVPVFRPASASRP